MILKMKQGMVQAMVMVMLMAWLMPGCINDQNVNELKDHYAKHYDFVSLERLSKHLAIGMPRKAVEELLGKPQYSPIEGQVYYGSKDGRLGMILEYHKLNITAQESVEAPTQRLQSIYVGEIRE